MSIREQEKESEKAIRSMALLYAHRLTTVYLVTGQGHLNPPRNNRGWPFFEVPNEALQEAPPLTLWVPNGVGRRQCGPKGDSYWR